uniref:Immunoglobulin domain-containing protein n=1 Tax=Seriola lalandi dorsalis TaxID=1841481 RepID=A0A3B4XGG2_SERLL
MAWMFSLLLSWKSKDTLLLNKLTQPSFCLTEWCCVKSKSLSGTVGHPLTMQCPYPSQHRTNRKFLCKGNRRNNCEIQVTSQNSGQTRNRFTLQDDASSSSFSVRITELRAGDAGTYWCGSDSQWSIGNYTKIHLSAVGVFRAVQLERLWDHQNQKGLYP